MAQLLLDRIPGAAAAYSLRKLSDSYAGAAVRVRRSSDNTEQDIGFVGVDLDQGALLVFVGAGIGYITKWYDQSGNNRDAVQATQAKQPWLVYNGTIQKVDNKPYIYFQGNSGDKYLSTSSGVFSTNSSRTIVCAYKPDITTGSNTVFNQGASVGSTGLWSAIQCRTFSVTGDPYFAGYNADLGNGLTTPNTSLKLASFTYNGTTGYLYKNSSLITSGGLSLNANISNPIYIGAAAPSTEPFTGYIGDIIVYPSDQSDNRDLIEDNINGYYNIYIPVTAQPNTLFTSAAAAYSLRKLYSDYPGPACRVRRSSDNAEADIYFVNDQLDQGALINHVGYGNLFQYSQDFTNAYWSKYPAGGTGPVITANTVDTTDPFGGSNATKIVAGGTVPESELYKSNIYNGADSIVLSVYAKAGTKNFLLLEFYVSASYRYQVGFNLSTGATQVNQNLGYANTSNSATSVGNGWYRCSIKVDNASQITSTYLYVCSDSISGTSVTSGNSIYLYGAQLNVNALQPYVQTTASTVTANGFVTTWYDQSYGSQQNLLTYSEQLSDASWTNNAIVTANNATSPEGTMFADTMTVATGANGISKGVSSVSSAQYTLSVYAKYNNSQWLMLQMSDVGITDRVRAWFDIQNGTTGGSATTGSGIFISSSITSLGNGWYRCSLTSTNPITTLYNYINLVSANNSTSAAANGQAVYLWGIQLTTGSYQRRYVATTSSTINTLRDASQGTAANQPRIVNGGVVDTQNGKTCVLFTVDNNILITSSTFSASTILTLGKVNTTNVVNYILGSTTSGVYYNGTFTGFNKIGAFDGTNNAALASGDTNRNLLWTSLRSSKAFLAKNGGVESDLGSFSSSLTVGRIGGRGTSGEGLQQLQFLGSIQEIICYPSDQSNNRIPIEQNINGYYSIY